MPGNGGGASSKAAVAQGQATAAHHRGQHRRIAKVAVAQRRATGAHLRRFPQQSLFGAPKNGLFSFDGFKG